VARHFKKWEEHSPRWQREQTRKGLDKKRWNAWLKLSDKTRKVSDPVKYASGSSITNQRRERKEQQAADKIRSVGGTNVRSSVVYRNVKRMTETDLNWTLKASHSQIVGRAGDKTVKTRYGDVNPWWYR